MPRKRPIDTRIDEAEARLAALKDEKRMEELRRRMRSRRVRGRR